MEADRYYPTLSRDVSIVLKLVAGDVGYLDDPACSYPEELKDALRAALQRGPSVTIDNVEAEAQRLYELKEFGASLEKADAAERNTYFRLSVALLEKLLDLMSNASRPKNLREFQDLVVSALENELTLDQWTRAISKLRS